MAFDDAPFPPRYGWLRRLSLLAVLWVIGLVGLRLWWGWEAQRRLDAHVAALRAAGEPVTTGDLTWLPTRDEDNAAFYLERAFEQLSVAALPTNYDAYGIVPAVVERFQSDFERWAEDNRGALDLGRLAAAKPETNWGAPGGSLFGPFRRFSSAHRELAKAVVMEAVLRSVQGRSREAIEALRVAYQLAETADAPSTYLIGHMVAQGERSRVLDALADILPGVTPAAGDESAGADPVQPALRELMAALRDEAPIRAHWRDALACERSAILETFAPVLRIGRSPPTRFSVLKPGELPVVLFRPAYALDAIRLSRGFQVLKDPFVLGTEASEPSTGALPYNLPFTATSLSSTYVSSTASAARIVVRIAARQRMGVLAIALKLYELDHGRRPAQLDELVPEYLSALPADPYAPQGAPPRYVPDDSPRLYCFGLDRDDDGGRGAEELKRSEGDGDLVFGLAVRPVRIDFSALGPPPARDSSGASRPASGEAADDDRDEEAPGGDAHDDQEEERDP